MRLGVDRRPVTFYQPQSTHTSETCNSTAMTCENCFKGFVLPGEPSGSMVGTAYFHPAPSPTPENSKQAIVLLSDIFGLTLVNCKIQADVLSEKLNMDVWVPDLFDGTCACECAVERGRLTRWGAMCRQAAAEGGGARAAAS